MKDTLITRKFQKIRYLIKKFFEVLHFYFFRRYIISKYYNPKAFDVLQDSWDGRDSLISVLIIRVSQILYSLKKSSMEVPRYISGHDLKKNIGFYSIQQFIDKKLSKGEEPFKKGEPLYLGFLNLTDDGDGTYSFVGEMDNNTFKVYRRNKTENGTCTELILYGEDKDKLFKPVEKPRYIYVKEDKPCLEFSNFKISYKGLKDVYSAIKNYCFKNFGVLKDLDNDYIETAVFEVHPEDYNILSDIGKGLIRGKIVSYHSLWQLRKTLKSFYDYEPDLADVSTYIEKYNEGKNKYIDEIARILKQSSDMWYI